MTATEEQKARKRVNNVLWAIGREYYGSLPIGIVDALLVENGLNETEPAIYCGREGSCTQQVGPRSYLTFTWYKMESGRYEFVAYCN
jgi:hypothetical protein